MIYLLSCSAQETTHGNKIDKIDNNLFKLSCFLDKIESVYKFIKKPFYIFYNKLGNLREDEVSIHSSSD